MGDETSCHSDIDKSDNDINGNTSNKTLICGSNSKDNGSSSGDKDKKSEDSQNKAVVTPAAANPSKLSFSISRLLGDDNDDKDDKNDGPLPSDNEDDDVDIDVEDKQSSCDEDEMGGIPSASMMSSLPGFIPGMMFGHGLYSGVTHPGLLGGVIKVPPHRPNPLPSVPMQPFLFSWMHERRDRLTSE